MIATVFYTHALSEPLNVSTGQQHVT